MPIQSGDVKLLKSAVMADVPEGGGAPTGTAIPDGVSNAIFPDISELDRAGGRVNLRKTFVSIQTDDTDLYFGGNVIVAEPPEDPRVSVTLFSNGETFDTRVQAQSRIEAYLNKGPEWAGYLFENHIAGQRVIQLFQRPEAEVPPVGRTLTLVYNEGLGTEVEQYVRAISVSAVLRSFYDTATQRDYEANVVTVEISDALRTDFIGSPASRSFTRLTNATKVKDTVVADAGTYVGVVPLTATAALGDFTVKGESVYTQLVPSAQTETPISFAPPYNGSGLPVPGVGEVSFTATHTWNTTTNFNLPGGCLPGSLTIVTGGITIYDEGGLLRTTSGTVGSIDYANGILVTNDTAFNSSKVVTYTPAAQLLRAPQSTEILVTQETRSQSYVGIIFPIPQPATLSISYMVQSRWYVLSDNGAGVLKGLDASYGAGTFNPDTGAFVVTLGALPDADSSIIITWNVPTQETKEPVVTLKAEHTIVLDPPTNKTVQPGSLTVAWEYSGAKTATASAAGVVSGDATGTLSVARGELTFAPNVMPAVGTQLTIDYVAGPKQLDNFTGPARDGSNVPVTASLGAITAGSLEVEWNTFTDTSVLNLYTREQLTEMGIQLVDPIHIARDDGAGNVVYKGVNIGTVNYATGAVVFNPDTTVQIPRPNYAAGESVGSKFRIRYTGITYVTAPSLFPVDLTGYVKLRYNSPGSTDNVQEVVTFAPSFKLVPEVNAQVVPGSVVLTMGSSLPWGDNGAGTLREYTTGGWVNRGTLSYVTGNVALTSWVAGTTNSISRRSTVTTVGEAVSSEYIFRTAAAPLRPASLVIQYAKAVGGTQTASADINGVISATGVQGTVDVENGVVRLRFGEYVTAAGNETQPWYVASNVETNGTIFKPAPVAASTVRYSAVAYSYLPLDAELLGIDPVRLPSDGRVPIFRPGGFAVVGHTGEITATVSNAQTINCGRVRLSRVRVVGNDGNVINTGYTTDLEAGTVTFTNVTGYSQPVTIQHRIEDMGVVREALISGDITFTRPLTHNYPLGSYVSSALIAGDLLARVPLVFDQSTWNGTFSDTPGAAATGTFNNTAYPITVTNRGALTEKWVARFTNSTSFEVIGENVGVIATGNTSTDCSPINPNSSAPYFTIPAQGWGTGWATGNVLRFNTIGSMFPVWVVRTVQQGPETVPDDSFTILIRGDVDTP